MTKTRALLFSVSLVALAVAPGCECQGTLTPRTTHDASTDTHADTGPSIAGLESFTIAPLDATLTIDAGIAATQAYTARHPPA